jgi:hypothetical protein
VLAAETGAALLISSTRLRSADAVQYKYHAVAVSADSCAVRVTVASVGRQGDGRVGATRALSQSRRWRSAVALADIEEGPSFIPALIKTPGPYVGKCVLATLRCG